MKKTTRWRPDTCGCEFEYQWDDSIAAGSRTHTVKKVVTKCPAHSTIVSDKDHFASVLEENQRKNVIYGKLLEVPNVAVEFAGLDGNKTKRLREGLSYEYKFDANRNLEVALNGATTAEKNALTTAASQLFGAKVVIK